MSYSKIIGINKHLQHSVNIEYDLMNFDKMLEYIPTSDVCNILKYYIDTTLWKEKDKATVLVGPYGKGKSFLVLMLVQIICFDNPNIKKLLKRIKIIDHSLYEAIIQLKDSKVKLLPIIIDSNYYNIEQSFLMALNDALKLAGLEHIVPETIYSVCLELIDKWEQNNELYDKVFHKCISVNKISLEELKKELQSYDINGYKHFETLYNCVTTGLNFNPMINSDVVKTYSNIIRQISDYGYSGVFIVYDEFSKTLDSNNEYLSKDLKIIQDFAEKANRSSKESQMHLCCITHKSLSLYKGNNNLSLESFKTVEGRFKEIHFNRSLDQNYQIIALSLNKLKGFTDTFKSYYLNNRQFYKQMSSIDLFDEVDKTILYKGCFPFNPISVYALVQLSELVSQNERTMFTLISDNDEHSFLSFVVNNEEGLYNIDKIYDYFSNVFASNSEEIRSIWYKSESTLLRVNENLDKKIIKSLACIRMINDFSKLSPSIECVALSIDKPIDIVEKAVNKLVDSKILKISFGNAFLDFSFSNIKEIDNVVDSFLINKKSYKKESEILESIYQEKYFMPREYNIRYRMTRYFISKFITIDEFMNINSFEPYLKKEFCDGLVINIIDSKLSTHEVIEKYNSIKCNSNVIINLSKLYSKNIIDEAKYIDALAEIKKNDRFDETTKNQINLIISEKTRDLTKVLSSALSKTNSIMISNFKGKTISELCTKICNNIYSKTPVVNIEMLNKNYVSTAYIKARNNIMNNILKRDDVSQLYTKTSPEMTVYNAFYSDEGHLAKDLLNVIKEIKTYLLDNNQQRKEISSIVKQLISSPYGIRKGVLPVYFSIAISTMTDNIILYFENSEIEINALNLAKMCENSERYYFIVEKRSKEKELYLEHLISSFGSKSLDSYYPNIKLSSSLIRKWILNLPIVLKEISPLDNFLKIDETFIKIKDIYSKFDINDYDTIINEIPFLFDYNYNKAIDFFEQRNMVFSNINNYTLDLSSQIKEIFIKEYKGSLNSCIKDWLSLNNIDLSKVIIGAKAKEILKILGNLSFDDVEAVNQIASSAIGYRIVDWSSNNADKLLTSLHKIKNKLETISEENSKINLDVKVKPIEISPIGRSFKNNIEYIIDEYNDSISDEEKAYILLEMVRKFFGGD